MRKFVLPCLLLALACLPLSPFAQEPLRGERPVINYKLLPETAFEKGKLRLKFKKKSGSWLPATPATDGKGISLFNNPAVDQLNQRYNARHAKRLFENVLREERFNARHRAWGFDLWYDIEVNESTSLADAAADYLATGLFDYAGPLLRRILFDQKNQWNWTPADPQFTDQWHYNNTGQLDGTADADIDLPEAWDIQKGSSNVIVAVMDSGVDTTHPDLRPNLWIGSSHRFGYNFFDDNKKITPGDHGTHTAGTIAAVNNNGIGVSGIAGGNGSASSGARIMSCQVFDPSGAAAADFASPYIFAADNGAAISQNSWGYTIAGAYDPAVLDAIDYFIQYGGGNVLGGGLVIFSMGNILNPGDNGYQRLYPGAYHRVLSVAATNNKDQMAYYSIFGEWADISAPGGELSYWDDPHGVLSTITVASGSYGYNHGTSMACPHVSGVAALVISHAPARLTHDDVRNILLGTADNHYGVNSEHVNELGTGRLNAFAALNKTNQMKAAPAVDTARNFSVSVSSCGPVVLNWTKNAANNNVMIAVSTGRSNVFGIPSGNFGVNDEIPGGGKVIYKGGASSFTYTGPLLDSVYYYFKIWSVTSGNNYSAGKTLFAVRNADQSPVTTFVSSAGNCQAVFNWTKSIGCPAQEVIVAINSTKNFGIPSGNLVNGNNLAGGGTVIYRGGASAFTHSGLGDSSVSYYAIWAANGSTYSVIPKILRGSSRSYLSAFTGNAVSSTQINLAWTKSSCFSGNVLIAYSSSGVFGDPSGTLAAGGDIAGGGKVIYTGSLANFNHTGLTAGATYYYKIWAIHSTAVYGPGKITMATTPCTGTALSLPVIDDFNSPHYNQCRWDTVFVSYGQGLVRPELSIVSEGTNPDIAPAEGGGMIKFNAYNCSPNARVRLVSKPINTNGGGIEIMYRWYHDNSNYTGASFDGEGVRVQWSVNGTNWNSIETVDRNPPSAVNASGWFYKQCVLPASALNNAQVRIGFLFTSKFGNNCYIDSVGIFNTKPKTTNGEISSAVSEFTDPGGWTHYNDRHGSRLLSIKKNGNNPGHVNQSGFSLIVGGTQGFANIANTGANYATNAGGWKTMNRYFSLKPITEPSTNCVLRFYYTTSDSIDLKNAALALSPPVGAVSNAMFNVYKINDVAATYDIDPAGGHPNIPKATAFDQDGFWQYGFGGTASTTNWSFGNMGGSMRYAEYIVRHFGGGGIGIGGAGQGALPVRWISFTGNLQNKNQAALTWVVSEEINVKDYEVQVSPDGTNFHTIGTVLPSAAATITGAYHYRRTLDNPGTYLFRINQNDLDGKFSFSVIIKIVYSENGLVVLAPNPATDYFELKGANGVEAVEITGFSGRLVKRFSPASNNIYPVKGISRGMYFVVVYCNGVSRRFKLMIQ